MIRTENLTKAYGARPILRGVSLQVSRGEVFGFIGPNGAGKTTFIKCLLGVVRADAGTARIDGVDALSDSLEARRRVGYAPGEIALYNRMRVSELLEFATAFHAEADLDWARSQLERLEVPLDRRVGKLSHGMKRKVLLMQALAVKTPLVVLDEPMEGLDPDARRQMEGVLAEQAEGGRTIFFSSHDLASVERICHRVAFLRAGELLEAGTVDELLERVSHVLTVRFRVPVTAGELPQDPSLHWEGSGTRWRLQFNGELSEALERMAGLPLSGIRDASGGLGEVFDALYGPAGNHASAGASGSGATC